jgi:NAD(P)H-nitrite reductase large subunit
MKVVIVGSGLAGVTLAEALAKSGRHDVTLATAEAHGYYSRPRLSHGVALSDEAAAKIVMKRFEALGPGVRVVAGTEAWLIDREKQHLVLRDGRCFDYDVLILATGSAARIPPALAASRPHFLTLNSLDDLLTLRRRRAKLRARGGTPRWAVVGGGLIGCEVASDLHKAGDAVTIFHREERLIELQLNESQSQALQQHFAARGVDVRYRQNLNELPRPFDGVIVAAGFAPRVASSSTTICAPVTRRSTPSAMSPRSARGSIRSFPRSAPRRCGSRRTSRVKSTPAGRLRPSRRSSRCTSSSCPPRR